MNIQERKMHDENIVKNILINRGITDINKFLEPDSSDDSLLEDFTNLEIAAKQLVFYLSQNSLISVVVDPDADGYTSSAILIQVMNDIIDKYELNSKVVYYMQSGKHHGLTDDVMDKISRDEPDLVLLPDSSSNDFDALLTLSTSNYNVIIIDHHELENEKYIDLIPNVTLVNNQREEDSKKVSTWLTGAGMVYKFCQSVYSLLNSSDEKLKPLEDYLDLVAIGQIGDASDISENEIRNLVFKGLNNIKTPFVKSVLKSKSIEDKDLAPQDMSFSIIPMINSVTRIGTDENKKDIFDAMIRTEENDETLIVSKRKLNKETRKYENIDFSMLYTENEADKAAKVKTKQDSIVKKEMAKLDEKTDLSQGILIYYAEQIENGSITGLVATKLSRKYERPCLVLLKTSDGWSGSARGIESVLDSFKDWCEDSGVFEFARGHANAFGVYIKDGNISKLEKLSKDFDKKPSTDYLVDKKYVNEVNKKDIDLLISFKSIIGGKVEPPLLGFEDLKVNKKNIYVKGQTLEFKVGGVSFVMWGCSDKIISSLEVGFTDILSVSLVGEPFSTNWGGVKKNKVIIKDISFDDAEDDFLF